MLISQKAAGLVGSEIIRLASEIKEKRDKGQEIFNLTIGDFDPTIYPIPIALKEEIIEAYNQGITNYPPANGIPELREAVSSYMSKRQGLKYDVNNIQISCGARPLIFGIYQTVVNPGEKVLFPVPSWNNNHYSHLSSAQQVRIATRPEDHFMPTAEQLKPYIQEAALIALCSPLNPTGTMFGKEQLEDICQLVLAENKRRGPNNKPVYILYDQIYWSLTYGEAVHYDPVGLFPEMRAYTIYVDGLSKAFAATGVRVGWALGPSEVMVKMKAILGHMGAWSPKAEQMATARYLQQDEVVDSFLTPFKKSIYASLKGLYDGFSAMANNGKPIEVIPPQGAIYLTVKFDILGAKTKEGKTLSTIADIQNFLIDEGKLAGVPFYAFGAEDEAPWYRLSVGTVSSSDVPAIVKNIETAYEGLTF